MKFQHLIPESLTILAASFSLISQNFALSQSIITLEEGRDIVEVGTNNAAYDKNACQPGPHDVPNSSFETDTKAPDHFYVKMPTTVTDISLPIIFEVNRTWAPIGVDRFYNLVKDNYYDCAAFFRVVPNFVVQWGIASDPLETLKWDTPILDDPVLESNTVGMVSFATSGQNTRTTQIFVNTVDNVRLDSMGFAPFAKVIQGMEDVFPYLYAIDPVPDQNIYKKEGNSWILKEYPDIDIVKGLSQSDDGSLHTTEILMTLEEIQQPEEEQDPVTLGSRSSASIRNLRDTIFSTSIFAILRIGW